MDYSNSAAHSLVNITLKTGWFVFEKVIRTASQTGGAFSVAYKVRKGEETCFLKVFDIASFFNNPTEDFTDAMKDMLEAYIYERDLSLYCKGHHVTKVSFVKEAGIETVPNFAYGVVPYLIFDLADGDIRSRIDFSKKLDFTWKLHSLHNVCVGLRQLHKINVSHQDLKPSNVLLFGKDSKIGDLGRAVCSVINNPYIDMPYSGDVNYLPPEIMYRYYEKDWKKRSFATDCYLLGSLIVFYFSGMTMSALLTKHIPENLRWYMWNGTFEEIEDYLFHSFDLAIDEFRENIDDDYFKKELSNLVKVLCHPLPEYRGQLRMGRNKSNRFELEQFIGKFNLLTHRAKIKFFGIKQ